jgi:hypothetical protein
VHQVGYYLLELYRGAQSTKHKILAFVCVYDVKICACVIEGQFDGYAIHETSTALTHPL